MIDLDLLITQVKRNCNISDAKYWGNYTICTLLLWLRELYGFENGIKPWEDIEKDAILDWISDREKLWAELEDRDFIPIEIEDIKYDPLNTEAINEVLIPHNMLYGAGYGQKIKPSFFLSELHKKDIIRGYAVYITDREYVRDLTFYPAMLQDKKIIVRRAVILHLLWDRFNELRSNINKSPLSFAFNLYGISPDEKPSEALNDKLMIVVDSEIESYIYHEIGELLEGERLGGQWKDFLFSIAGSRVELFARGVKDLLADTSEDGLFKHLIDGKRAGSLAFYVASLRGYRKSIFREIPEAFKKFVDKGDWDEIEKGRVSCYKRVMHYAETILDLYKKETERTTLIKHIEQEFRDIL